jgi:hypothetical protein
MLGYTQNENQGQGFKYVLTVSGKPIGLNKVTILGDPQQKFTVHVNDDVLGRELLNVRFSDIPIEFDSFWIRFPGHLAEIGLMIGVEYGDENNLHFVLRTTYNLTGWKRIWSAQEFGEELESIAPTMNLPNLKVLPVNINDLKTAAMSFEVENPDSQLETELRRRLPIMRELLSSAVASLSAKVRSDSMVTFFDFPETVKVPCQQYLLYFVQFLKDVGVEATAELEEHAGRVLFAVTPKDETVALGKIREALDLYLELPKRSNGDLIPAGADIAAQRMGAEILHLKSQLMLIAATLQQKDMLIDQQQQFINQQLLTGQVLISSMHQPSQAAPTDEESLIGDLVSVTPLEIHGMKFNLPGLLRWLKERFAERDPEQE